jgi:hypothetical protein
MFILIIERIGQYWIKKKYVKDMSNFQFRAKISYRVPFSLLQNKNKLQENLNITEFAFFTNLWMNVF